jgi:hypothetical protein
MESEDQSVSNAPESTSSESQQEQTAKEDVVSYESHQKLLKQYKRDRERLKALEDERVLFGQKQKEIEETKLREKGEFQKLLDIRQKELDEYKTRLNTISQEKDETSKALTDTFKLNAFYDKLPGKIKRREYLNFVDLDSIVIDPETGSVDEQSVDMVASSFMKEYKDLVDTSHFGKLPGNAAQSPNHIDANSFRNLSLKDMKLKLRDAVQAAKRKQGVK